MLTTPPSPHSSPLLSGAFATEQREKLLDRPLSARFDLLGPGHRQHPEQPTHEGPWNFWNGVRTVFSSLALFALIGACLSRSDSGSR
jgi:hypothetical protein